ncbi:hypothetical protein GCM10023320_09960 [Pseudonocardia adelaidensis]|uniref:Uncharacterized protein n=1 Tax=Pseudonocardia adelaidensis TaxID=648754 RepID=A0ABP9NB99_9PSEU
MSRAPGRAPGGAVVRVPVPERYWPDCVPSGLRPDTSMTAHGYQMPPTGPSVDGVDL